ncbi:hypothetical protein FDP41_007924 [Naegleria fowleri]|uniref:Uncharacterized protein n=1 Tax=Naegleria fowleri TaxID=5763 RepID=A0A6A5CFC6_NAEFO|nr:uncharacterized protein FDP41_007924 [Naegleria fowleri]KAF0984009.1 hypothetical protein FDP41_007924 [Naegleria fowleri]CAG4716403.1 unnamed protein product [Naegleria fowleri]
MVSKNSTGSISSSQPNNNSKQRSREDNVLHNQTTSSSDTEAKPQTKSTSDSYNNVIRGALKLKGRISKPTKTQSFSKQHAMKEELEQRIEIEKTEAEARFEQKMMETKKKLIKEKAEKSYREKINEFNEKISKLSEYHDIPKV